MKSNRNDFSAAGSEYQKHLAEFDKFLESLRRLEERLPSLKIGARDSNQVEVNFLGEVSLLRLKFDYAVSRGVSESTITRLPPQSQASNGMVIKLNGEGDIGFPNGNWSSNVSRDEDNELVFYYLMNGP